MILKDAIGNEIECYVSGTCFDDAVIEEAYYVESGQAVNEGNLQWLYDNYPDRIEEACFENAVGQADDLMDSWKDQD